jgi:hypothetical protein
MGILWTPSILIQASAAIKLCTPDVFKCQLNNTPKSSRFAPVAGVGRGNVWSAKKGTDPSNSRPLFFKKVHFKVFIDTFLENEKKLF